MDESEINGKIVSMTVETMELAEQVLIERQKNDGKEFSAEKPSNLEVVAVSNLIINMSVAGMFKEKKSDDWIPSPAALRAFIEKIEPIIEAKVSLAVSKAQHLVTRARIEAKSVPVAPVPPLGRSIPIDLTKGPRSEGNVSGFE